MNNQITKKEISIVIPVYNEEKNIQELYKRLSTVMNEVTHNYEIIFCNDGSIDTTQDQLKLLAETDKKVKVITFSRNFGQQAAITAGLDIATGEKIITMDADLQDPPELIPEFISKADAGYDVVYGVSEKRNDPYLRKALFHCYYFTMDKFCGQKFPRNVGIFALMKRPVVDTLLQVSERNRFVPALRSWVGYNQTGIPYSKPPRFAGKETQSLSKLFRMGTDALFSFSYVPLRITTILGLVVSFIAFLAILNVLYQKLFAGTAILGWSSPLVSTLFIGGVELIMLGIIGEYLGRIYDEVKRRPHYVISHKINFEESDNQYLSK